MIDITKFLGQNKRSISSKTVDGELMRSMVIERPYEASLSEVWDAITNIERIPTWFMPISGDLKLGGSYELTGNASGKILECEPETRFRITWEFGGNMSWVEVKLKPEGEDRTLFWLEHSAVVPEEMWDTYGPGAGGVGWELGLFGLANHFHHGEKITPDKGEEWTMSDEGKQFIRTSSAAWGEASIADGTEPEKAKKAADATTGFYTGEG